jgi:beta-N-acetylhexosaminidase
MLVAALTALGGCGSPAKPPPAPGRAAPDNGLSFAPGPSGPAPARAPGRKISRPQRPHRQVRARRAAAAAVAPPIVSRFIPFGVRRRREMADYSRRHYGVAGYRLVHPRVIVEHYTETPSASAAFATFAPDVPDTELHELPGICAHFVVDRDGTIYQLVPVALRCRHTVGLNYTAIGIENVGYSDRQILADARQLRASLALTTWLRCRFAISVNNVIGHNESLASPFHHELVARLRTQTHGDWSKPDMDLYRAKLGHTRCR